MNSTDQITGLLLRIRAGDAQAQSELFAAVYGQLHRIAQQQLRSERPGNTLQPTALVNELYLRLKLNQSIDWQDRAHLFAVVAKTMRRILIDRARARNAQRRPSPRARIDLDDAFVYSEDHPAEVLAVHEALERLAEFDQIQAKVVELRFFAGLSVEETAGVLNISERTVKRHWRMARAWLSHLLNSSADGGAVTNASE